MFRRPRCSQTSRCSVRRCTLLRSPTLALRARARCSRCSHCGRGRPRPPSGCRRSRQYSSPHSPRQPRCCALGPRTRRACRISRMRGGARRPRCARICSRSTRHSSRRPSTTSAPPFRPTTAPIARRSSGFTLGRPLRADVRGAHRARHREDSARDGSTARLRMRATLRLVQQRGHATRGPASALRLLRIPRGLHRQGSHTRGRRNPLPRTTEASPQTREFPPVHNGSFTESPKVTM